MAATGVRRLEQPLLFAANVVTGFQRGSKELGWPTANLDNTPSVQAAIEAATLGVYCGWATCAAPTTTTPPAPPLSFPRALTSGASQGGGRGR